jgi:hypothetical protein
MINQNIAGKATLYSLIPNAAGRSATATGTGVDVSACKGSIAFVLDSAAASAGDTLDVTIEHSDASGSGYTAVTGGAFTQVTSAAAAQQIVALNADSLKKYVRAVGTIAGNGSESIVFAVHAIGWTA